MNRPLLLRPSAKDYLWGGTRINDEFAKGIDLVPLAETWECSTHPDGPCYVACGEYSGKTLKEVLEGHPEYLGEKYRDGKDLPLLVKFIDARENLSVQVHPDDQYANKHEGGQRGKEELWYVLDASKDASVVLGLKHSTNKEALLDSIYDGTIEKYLQRIPIKKDDVYFINAGVIHAIGAGTLIAEIQESSNLTYRLYDYDRSDKNGKKRELHTEKALEVAKLTADEEPRRSLRVLRYSRGMALELLCRSHYFEVYRMVVNTERRQNVSIRADSGSFRILLCINGCGVIGFDGRTLKVYKGDCVFVPADSCQLQLHGSFQFLDIRG